MSINLTDNQKQLIKWLVEKLQEGKLTEEFLVYGTSNGYRIAIRLEEEEKPPEITKSALIALARADLLIYELIKSDSVRCALTGKAFTAVANDFQETSTLIVDLQVIVLKLQKNLNDLREREAKYGGSAPPDLLNQIEDHEMTIDLTNQVVDVTSKLQKKLGSLNIADDLKSRLISILGEK